MEEAEQRHLSMTLIFIMASALWFLPFVFWFCHRGSWQPFLKSLHNVFFLINFAYGQNLSKKEPYYEKLLYGPIWRLYAH